MRKILIVGGASAIASEAAKLFAQEGAELFLCDLKKSRLEAVRDDILSRHNTKIEIEEFDALDFEKHAEFLDSVVSQIGGIDVVLIAHGTLPNQTVMQEDNLAAVREFNINGLSVISFATVVANYFEKVGKGTLAVISSVAGDRGRKSNYLYGSAKGAVSLFLQGLRNRLASTEVKVITIKPGMVDTPMTANMPKSFLFAKSEVVGKGIYDAINSGKDIVYLPMFWRCIMFIIKHIPEVIFKKLNL